MLSLELQLQGAWLHKFQDLACDTSLSSNQYHTKGLAGIVIHSFIHSFNKHPLTIFLFRSWGTVRNKPMASAALETQPLAKVAI